MTIIALRDRLNEEIAKGHNNFKVEAVRENTPVSDIYDSSREVIEVMVIEKGWRREFLLVYSQ